MTKLSVLPAEIKALGCILGITLITAELVSVTSSTPTTGVGFASSPRVTRTPHRETPLPSVLAGALTGEETDRARASRRPIAVVLDNFNPDARPQAGIGQASIVFEALVEGGITRLLALYQERNASNVGPIRSARSYFVAWAAGFRSLFVHSGGAPSALSLLRNTRQLGDLDALARVPEFRREKSRVPPHDLFSSTSNIYGLAERKAVGASPVVSFSIRQPDVPLRSRGHVGTIGIDFSTVGVPSPPAYRVAYRYLRRRNLYARSQGGTPFMDSETGSQVLAKNVIVLTVDVTPIPGDPEQRVNVQSVGHGRAVVFRDGRAVQCSWRKVDLNAPLQFVDGTGRTIRLDVGTTWIEAVPTGGVQYSRT